jgi:hypothetical protein
MVSFTIYILTRNRVENSFSHGRRGSLLKPFLLDGNYIGSLVSKLLSKELEGASRFY